MSLEQNDIDTIATLVEQYVGEAITTLATRVQEIVNIHESRIGALESSVQQAVYREWIASEAVRLGLSAIRDPYELFGNGDHIADDKIGAPND